MNRFSEVDISVVQVIEDDLVTCHIVSALLKRLRLGHCVASTGEQALEQLGKHPINLILADLSLPDVSGLEVIERVVTTPYLQDIPIIVCSSATDTETVMQAMALGAVDFVRKPMSVDDLAERIGRALKRAPVRWEPWRELVRRLGVDNWSSYPKLLGLAREQVVTLIDVLDGAARGDRPASAVHPEVPRARDAAVNVGAIRAASSMDFFWTGNGKVSEAAELRDALRIELGAFDRLLATLTSGGIRTRTPNRVYPSVA